MITDNNLGNIRVKEASIIKALVFFDMFDFPLTAFEVWQYLDFKCDLVEVIDVLDHSEFLKACVKLDNGYYFLKEREDIVSTRLERYHSSARKFKKAKRFVYLFRQLPWVRMVAMANMIGPDNLREPSDIDLFIIVAPKRIWITRFFCVLITKAFNARPKPGKEKDKICLSFYLTDNNLNIKNLMLDDDVYFKYWLVLLSPILNRNKIYEKFINSNELISKEFPNWNLVKAVKNRKVKSLEDCLYFEIFEMFFGGLDQVFKKLQLKILAPGLKKKLNKDTRVVMNDQILKMYSKDRREIYKKRYLDKLKDIL